MRVETPAPTASTKQLPSKPDKCFHHLFITRARTVRGGQVTVFKSPEHREMILMHNKPLVLVQNCPVKARRTVCFSLFSPSLNASHQAEMLSSLNTDEFL